MMLGAARAAIIARPQVVAAEPVIEDHALRLSDDGSVSSKTVTLTVNSGELALGFMVTQAGVDLNLPSGYADVHGGEIGHDDLVNFSTRWVWDSLGSGIASQAFTISSAVTSWFPGLVRISNAHATTPINQQAFTTNQITDVPVSPAISDTTVDNCLILRILLVQVGGGFTGIAYPSSTTGLFLDQIAAGMSNEVSASLAYHVQETAGAVGASAAWGDFDVNRRCIAGTVAIAPPGS